MPGSIYYEVYHTNLRKHTHFLGLHRCISGDSCTSQMIFWSLSSYIKLNLMCFDPIY